MQGKNSLFSAIAMLAKLTAKNQLTLPKAAMAAVGAAEYFDVQARGGVIVLTPVRVQRADAVRAKPAELALTDDDIDDAVEWARLRVAAGCTSRGPGVRLKRLTNRLR